MSPECIARTSSLAEETSGGKYSRKTIVYSFVCILCTIINIGVFNTVGEPEVMTFRDVAKLRRPNPFIGLDTIDTSDHPMEPILLYPVTLSKVNKAEPRRAYGDDPVKFAAWGGTDPPVDREFKVTATISTLVEFRTIDYGMENCQLLLTTPATMAHAHNSKLHSGPGDNWVDIWKLNVTYPMDRKLLSWDTRPSRLRKLDKIAITPGMNYTYQFSCPSDSLHAFEFSAVDESTDIAWSQDHSHHPNPVMVMQHPSKRESVADSLSLPGRERIKAPEYDSADIAQPTLSWSIPKLEHVAMRIIPWTPYFKFGAEAWKKQLPSGGHVIHLANLDGTLSTYTVAMFHQLRCLEILQNAYLDEGRHQESPLAQHCMNYLRQTMLCEMDLRNEEQGSNPTHNGADALCYDWEAIYEEAEKNFDAYSRYSSRVHTDGAWED